MILALETSTRIASAALVKDESLLAEFSLDKGGMQGKELAPAVEKLLEQNGIALKELDLVAVGLGPGSYTGLRVGVALARSLAYAADLDVVGVSSFAACALMALKPGEEGLTLCKAGQDDCYYALFRKVGDGVEEIEPHAIGPRSEALSRCRPEQRLLDEATALPTAHGVGLLGGRKYKEEGRSSEAELNPLYLRRSKAEINWERRRGG